jgi:hypothetical protein
MVKIGSSNWLVTGLGFFYFFPLWSAEKYCICHGQFTLLVDCSYCMWYVCLYRWFRCAVISFKFCFFSSILLSVLTMSITQVADALDIKHIKCTKLKDCHHVDLFNDTRKVRKISASPHSALAICANYLLETRRQCFGNYGCVGVQFPRCWLELSCTSLLFMDTLWHAVFTLGISGASPNLHNSELSIHSVNHICLCKAVYLETIFQYTVTWSPAAWPRLQPIIAQQ